MLPELQRGIDGRVAAFVTVAPSWAYVKPHNDSRALVLQLREAASGILEGFESFGVIEPALFEHYGREGSHIRFGHKISWHFHAIVWGCELATIRSVVKKRTLGLKAIAEGLKPVDVRVLDPATLEQRLCYAVKLPRSGYRLAPDAPQQGGAIALPEKLRLRVKKHPIRPKERLIVIEELATIRAGELVVVSGLGHALFRDCVRQAALLIKQQIDRARRMHFSRQVDKACHWPPSTP